MKRSKAQPDRENMERALEAQGDEHFVLSLYVAGMTPRSTLAITNIKEICEEHLAGRHSLEVVDIYKRPSLAKDEQIVAAPTLLKKLPLPLRKFIGDMSDTKKLIVGLDLRPNK